MKTSYKLQSTFTQQENNDLPLRLSEEQQCTSEHSPYRCTACEGMLQWRFDSWKYSAQHYDYIISEIRTLFRPKKYIYTCNSTCFSISHSTLKLVSFEAVGNKKKELGSQLTVGLCVFIYTIFLCSRWKSKTYSSNPWLFNSSMHFCVRISILSSR